MATLNIRIQLRNDTAENWNTQNPILLKGEMGVETDTGKTKIGNGTAHWKDLKYSGVDEDTIKGIIDKNRDNFTEVIPNEGESDAQALAHMVTNPKIRPEILHTNNHLVSLFQGLSILPYLRFCFLFHPL